MISANGKNIIFQYGQPTLTRKQRQNKLQAKKMKSSNSKSNPRMWWKHERKRLPMKQDGNRWN